MNGDNVSKRTDTIAAPVAQDDIAIDNIKQKKNSKSHNDNKDNNTNHEASSNVDSNGNIVGVIDAKENKKKKSPRTTKQRSKSFHIKCDRKYTKYYQIEYKGTEKTTCSSPSDKSGNLMYTKSESSPANNFDCSEEYFVDDEDENMSSNAQMQRSTSLEPKDYKASHEEHTNQPKTSLGNPTDEMTLQRYPEFSKTNDENRLGAKHSLNVSLYPSSSPSHQQIQRLLILVLTHCV